MKKYLLMAIVASLSVTASAGIGTRGGGDLCEDRIKIIRDDIKEWITMGGADSLQLPQGVTVANYSKKMLAEISASKIRCVGAGDRGYPVNINGTPKVCIFAKNNSASRITCDFTKFNATNESDQYVLVHHEYAGISDIENPNEDDSNYFVSNQISGSLVDQWVKRLAVRPEVSLAQCYKQIADGIRGGPGQIETKEAVRICKEFSIDVIRRALYLTQNIAAYLKLERAVQISSSNNPQVIDCAISLASNSVSIDQAITFCK